MEDLLNGELDAAREQLYRVDPMQLPKEQRVRLYEALKQFDQAQAADAAAVEAAAIEAEAQTDEPADVIVMPDEPQADTPPTPTPEAVDPSVAAARAAQAQREQDAATTRTKALLDRADQQMAAGDYAGASASLDAAAALNADLGWFDQQRLESQQLAVAEQRSQMAAADSASGSRAGVAAVGAAAGTAAVASRNGDVPKASQDLLIQAQKAYAQDLADNAADAQRQGYNELAVNLYSEAADLDPNNKDIAARLAAAEQARLAQVAPQNVLEQVQQRDDLRLQAADTAYNAAMNDARAARKANDFDAAIDSVNNAKIVLDRNARLYTTAGYNQRRAAANDLAVAIQRDQIEVASENLEKDEEERIKSEEEALKQAERERRDKTRQLFIDARDLQRQMRYTEALDLINQALFIDPQNVEAQAIKPMLEDMIVLVDQKDFTRRKRLMQARQSTLNLEASIPYDDLLVYPSDWPQLTQRRLEALDVTGGESRQNRDAALKLETSVPVNFEANPLEAVISYLRTTTGVNIFVNWPALNLEGIQEDMPITLQLSDVPAKTALEKVLQLANAGAGGTLNPAVYSIIDGVVEISTQSELNRTTEARVYDIRDLLVQVPNFTDAPEFELSDALEGGGSGSGGGGGGGGSIFGDTDEEDDEDQPTREELITQILEIIQDSVGSPDEWINLDSTITELNGNLIIKSTPQNHRDIVGVLGDLREQRATQISVEARFLLVDNNFLEEFGIDLDFRYKSQGNWGPIVVDQDSVDIASRGTTSLTPGRFTSTDGANPTSLTLGVSFIDDLEVDLLITATQANNRSMTLTAPRVTFFNGQRAYVLVARQVAFISDLEPVPDTGGFDITTSVVNSGVVLDVEGTVSADRRYVTMTMRPSLATLKEPIETLPIRSATVGEGDDGGIIPGTVAFIQLPELEVTQVRSTVSVPDKGTLLLGGQRLVGEVEIEAGVPVLSKLPVINRLFTNTSTVKDERTLLILIKPTIILQSEQEELLFPGLNDDPAKYNVGSGF